MKPELPHPVDPEMDRLAQLSFRARGLVINEPARDPVFWDARFHGFTETFLWRGLGAEARAAALKCLQEEILTEAYFIEGAGMKYAARMSLDAESIPERKYFATMGAEEAAHFQMLAPFFPADIDARKPNSFTGLIGKIADCGERQTQLLLLQVLLEGWGIVYYQSLADHAVPSALASVFREILRDESRHHSGGVLLHRRGDARISPFCEEALLTLLEMVRCGPVTAAATALKCAGSAERATAIRLLNEMDAEAQTRDKLMRLKALLKKSMIESEVDALTFRGMFDPMPVAEMAAVTVSLIA